MRRSISVEPAVPPQDADAWAERAIEATKKREWWIVVEAIERAIELGWDSAGAHGRLGWVLNELARYDEAIEPLERALERCQDPQGLSWIHTALAFSYVRLHDPGRAMDHYQAAVDADPTNAAAHQGVGAAHAEFRHYAEAVPHLEEATRLAPKDRDAWYALGSVLSWLGELERAGEALRRSIALGRTDGKPYAQLAWVYQRQGRRTEAADLASRALRKRLPHDWRAWTARIANESRKRSQ